VFGQIVVILVALLVGLAAVAMLWLLGMRTRFPPTVKAMAWFTRTIMNPRQMKSAGTAGAYASVIRCQGRKSGRIYETPVVPLAAGDGFVIALPYGPGVNWLRNVLANGSATLVHAGRTYEVDQPEVVPMRAVESFYPASERQTNRVFGVRECLRVRKVSDEPAAQSPS
jgi:hypothetical protein